MSAKKDSCLAILKKYSLLVDFDGEAPMNRIAPAIEGETFGQWKKRLWGDDAPQVMVYTPTEPKPNKRMATLQREADVEHLQKIFRQLAREQREETETKIHEEKGKIANLYSTAPKNDLQDAVENLADELEPSVSEHLKEYLAKLPGKVSFETLFNDLLRKYNEAAKQQHQREREIASLKQALREAQEQTK